MSAWPRLVNLSLKSENLISHVSAHERCTLTYNLDYCWYYLQITFLVCLSKDNSVCLAESRVIVFFIVEVFWLFLPLKKSLLKGGKLHLDVRYGTSQEACPSVCSTRVTVSDLRGDQGGLRLQALRPWMSEAASLCCLKFWQLCQQTIPAH